MLNNDAKSSEQTFICEILRTFIAKELALRNRKAKETTIQETNLSLPEQINWHLLERIAGRNGLIAILQSILGSSQIPEQRRNKWKRYSVQTLFNYNQAEKATVYLFKVMEEEAIPAITMRGMALTQWVYSDPILRPMVDVDILIPTEARHNLIQKLEKHGLVCARVLRSQFIYEIDNTKFEVHWSFLTPKRYRTAANFDNWIDTRQAVKANTGTIYCFSPENELLDLVCHAFIHHELDTLLKLTDIALVAQSENLDWDYITRWCDAASMTKLFALTFGVIDYLFDFRLLDNFQRKEVLPSDAEKYYKAYSARFFQMDSITHFLRRKQAMLYAAEKYSLKFKQFLRFISVDQITDLMKAAKSQHSSFSKKP